MREREYAVSASMCYTAPYLSSGLQLSQFLHEAINLRADLLNGGPLLCREAFGKFPGIPQHLHHRLNACLVHIGVQAWRDDVMMM